MVLLYGVMPCHIGHETTIHKSGKIKKEHINKCGKGQTSIPICPEKVKKVYHPVILYQNSYPSSEKH